METTTDFEQWLGGIELEGYEEIYSLHRSIKDCTDMGPFKTVPARGSEGRWIVSGLHLQQALLLASEEAKETFLNMLERRYCGDMNMEGWYGYMHGMSKND